MWLRRVGLPPLWPSRLKVTIMCALQSGFIYSFTTYLNDADVDYLDLSRPKKDEVHCSMVEPVCKDGPNPLGCLLERNELLFGAVHLDSSTSGACPNTSSNTCSTFALPMRSIHGDLGHLHTTNRWLNPLRLWAFLFALLTSLFIATVLIHDHALIIARCRPSILSLRSLQRERPLWWACGSCLQFVSPMDWLRRRCRLLWIVLLPLWWVYRVLIFVCLIYPVTLLAALPQPVGFSRIMVFSTGILCCICALFFDISVIFLETDLYALFWNAEQLGRGCVCYCEYPLSGHVVQRLVFLGFVVFAGAFSVSFRALKGLRRANWGNLFSVLYAVPVEVFPVCWERPKEAGGGPITFRKPGEEVQGEPAFDPFCLMDEQPESGSSCARLRPEPQGEAQRKLWMPIVKEAEIGCCGIPLPSGSRGRREAELDEVTVEDPSSDKTELAADGAGDGPGEEVAQAPVNGVLLHGLTGESGSCVFEGRGESSPASPRSGAPQAPAASAVSASTRASGGAAREEKRSAPRVEEAHQASGSNLLSI